MVSKGKRGITLISLVVTIIVLLILAGISIQAITGNEGIINRAIRAKELSEIDNEKEILETVAANAIGKDKYGNITKVGLTRQLETYQKEKPTSVESDEELNMLYVTFTNSGRTYYVDSDGNITYLGTETELRNTVNISVNPESNTTPQLIQYVDLTVSSFVALEDDEIFIHYAWTKSESEEPLDTDYVVANAQVSTSKKKRTATITSSATQEGNYYLYVQVKLTDNTITKKFGPYAIKDHTTLRSCSGERDSTSPFLGNSTIKRNKVERVNLVKSISGHSTNDDKCWDVSDSQNGKILAWYEDADSDGYYEVTIGQDGGINANANSSYLFNLIGYNGDDTTVISGIENLDTELVTNMQSMFDHCNNLTSLDLSNFDTSNVTNMYSMFGSCKNLTSLDLSNFNTSNVTTMLGMFRYCSGLISLNMNKLNTINVTTMYGMFDGCKSLTSLNVSSFNTSKVTNMGCIFDDCCSLTSIDVSNFNTSNVTDMSSMFRNCSKLTKLDVSKFDTSKVTGMVAMFFSCKNLTSLDVSKFDTSNVIYIRSMFESCNNLTGLDLSNFDTSKVIAMTWMFKDCGNLTSLDVSNFDTSNVTSMGAMFRNCGNLTSLDVSSFNTNRVKDMGLMFAGCGHLTSLDVSNFDTNKVTDMYYMFHGCNNLKTIYAGDKWNTDNVASSGCMFLYDTNLVGGAGTTYDSSHVDKEYAHIDGGTSNPGYFTSK